MFPRNPFLRFLIFFLPLYVGLWLLPHLGISDAYGSYFRSFGALFYGNNDERELTFQPLDDPSHFGFTRIEIANRALLNSDESGEVRHLDFDTMALGCGPTALLIALIVATPIPWSRKRWTLLWGLLWQHVFIILALGFLIWNESSEIGLVILTPFWKHLAVSFKDVLVSHISLTIPVIIWVLVTFRQEDWKLASIGRATSLQRSPA